MRRASLADYRVVYFATHGLVAGDIKGLAEPSLALTIPPQPNEFDDGLLTAIDEKSWQTLIPTTFAGRMSWLIKIAGKYNRSRHRKTVRGPKKKAPQKTTYRNGHHLSVKKILDARNATQSC